MASSLLEALTKAGVVTPADEARLAGERARLEARRKELFDREHALLRLARTDLGLAHEIADHDRVVPTTLLLGWTALPRHDLLREWALWCSAAREVAS